jgi:hypothetical protein
MWKNILMSLAIMTVTGAAMTASTLAAFTAKATVSGITFSTGSAALKLFGNLAYTNPGNNGNLTTTLPGMEFDEIGPNWSDEYKLKYFNTGSVDLMTSLTLSAHEGSDDLAPHIMVETWLWDDTDGNGETDESDGYTLLATEQPLSNLVSTPVALGQLDSGDPRGIQLRFKTGDLPSSTQDQEATFDFVIQGTTEGTTQEL